MTRAPHFSHVVLQTPKPAEMKEWYTSVLDAHVVFGDDEITFLTFDDEHHRIALVSPPPGTKPRQRGGAGMHHMSFTFDGLGDLLSRYEALKSAGILPRVPVQHGFTTSLYYEDPDGNWVELQVDNFPRPDEATDYMRGEDFHADPIGPSFDVDRMLQARGAGVADEVLMTRAWAREDDHLPHPIEAFATH